MRHFKCMSRRRCRDPQFWFQIMISTWTLHNFGQQYVKTSSAPTGHDWCLPFSEPNNRPFQVFSNLYFKICWHVWKNYLCPLDAGAHLNLAPCCTMRLWSGCSNVEVWALCAALHSTHYVVFGMNQFLVWVCGWIWSTLKCHGWRKFLFW